MKNTCAVFYELCRRAPSGRRTRSVGSRRCERLPGLVLAQGEIDIPLEAGANIASVLRRSSSRQARRRPGPLCGRMPSPALKSRSPASTGCIRSDADVRARDPDRWPDFDALGHLNQAVPSTSTKRAALRRTIGDFDRGRTSSPTRRSTTSEIALGVREIVVSTDRESVARAPALGRPCQRLTKSLPRRRRARRVGPEARRSREITQRSGSA